MSEEQHKIKQIVIDGAGKSGCYYDGIFCMDDLKSNIDKFYVKPSIPDGHCLLHSIVNSVRTVSNESLSKQGVIDKIRDESLRNIDFYSVGHSDRGIYITEMNNYLDKKIYDSDYADLVPNIIANCLPANLYILICEDGTTSCYTHDIKSRDPQTNINIYLRLTNKHYDALLIKDKNICEHVLLNKHDRSLVSGLTVDHISRSTQT